MNALIIQADAVVFLVKQLRGGTNIERIREANDRLQFAEGEADKVMLQLLKELYQSPCDPRELVILHDLYRNEWRLYKNFFIPNTKGAEIHAGVQPAQGEAVVHLLQALVEHYADRPYLLGPTRAEGVDAGSAEALRAAVSYVAGMTDRYACRQAVSLLDWDRSKLPRGIDV